MPAPVSPLTACASDQWWCRQALEITGDSTWARAANLLIGKPLTIFGLVVAGLVIRWVLHRVIDRVFGKIGEGVLPDRLSPAEDLRQSRRVQRAQAMASLFKSTVTGIVVAIVGTMVLAEFDINIAPILASAGIVGVALGFGAQSLVKDWLAGIAMIFEDQYGVGDSVDLGEASGTVEAVSLRVTRLRDVNGTVWYVRNGEILRVGNQSQNWARSVLDITVSPEEDLHRVREVLKDVAHDLWDDEEFSSVIIEEPEVWGVQDLTPDGVVMRVTLKTAPMEQWRVARAMRERIAARFLHEGIAFPQRMQWARHTTADPAADGAAIDPENG